MRRRRPVYSVVLPLVVHEHASYQRLRRMGFFLAGVACVVLVAALVSAWDVRFSAVKVLFSGIGAIIPLGLVYTVLKYRTQGELRLSELSITIREDGREQQVFLMPFINHVVLQAEKPSDAPYTRLYHWARMMARNKSARECRLVFDCYHPESDTSSQHTVIFRLETASEYSNLVYLARKWDHLIVDCQFCRLIDTPALPAPALQAMYSA